MTTKPCSSTDSPKVPAVDAIAASKVPHVAFQMLRGRLSDNGATPWYATVGLGTPAQQLRFMIDTGTVNTWITASCCASPACKAHRSFDPARSSTYKSRGEPPKVVDFGPWGTMGVVEGGDVCHLERHSSGKCKITPLDEAIDVYLAVSYAGTQFRELVCDGGLAVPAVPSKEPTALLPQLKRQKLIQYAVASFSFDAQRGAGQCLMGAVDPERFDPRSLNVLPVISMGQGMEYLWGVCLERFACAGDTVATGVALALDTGSSRFKGGSTIIAKIRAAITDDGKRPTVVGNESALADYPDLTLTLGGVDYHLTPRQYFMKISDSRWELGVHYLEGLPDDLLLVGSVFLDTVYSVFYYETEKKGVRAIGLATPKRKTMSVMGIWENEFGSTLEVGPVAADGTFRATYRSHTGATGVYPVMGVADPDPVGTAQAVSFSVTWRSLEGDPEPSWHWVSGFTGLLELVDGEELIKTTYLLQQNATDTVPDWMATAVYASTFKRKG